MARSWLHLSKPSPSSRRICLRRTFFPCLAEAVRKIGDWGRDNVKHPWSIESESVFRYRLRVVKNRYRQFEQSRSANPKRIYRWRRAYENQYLSIGPDAIGVYRLRWGTNYCDHDDHYARGYDDRPAPSRARGCRHSGSAARSGRSTNSFARTAVRLDTGVLALDRSRLRMGSRNLGRTPKCRDCMGGGSLGAQAGRLGVGRRLLAVK